MKSEVYLEKKRKEKRTKELKGSVDEISDRRETVSLWTEF